MQTAFHASPATAPSLSLCSAPRTMETRLMQTARSVAFGAYVLDREDRSLWKGERRIAIAPKEFGLLDLLTRHAGRLVEKQEILATVWAGTHVSDAVVKVCVRKLRQILEDSMPSPRFIETAARHGYRFVARVESCAASSGDLLSSSLPLVASAQAAGIDLASLLTRSVDLARESARAGRYDQSVLHFKAALKTAGLLSPQEPALVHDLRLRMSEAAHRAGQVLEGRAVLLEALADARAARDPARFASAVLALGGGHQAILSGDRGLVDLLEEALKLLPREQAALRACIEARLAYALARFPEQAHRKRQLVRASQRRSHGERTLRQEALILRYRLWASWGPSDLRFRLAGSRRLESYAKRLDDRHAWLYALGLRTASALEAADAGLYEKSRASYLELAAESGCRWTDWNALRFRVLHATLTGRFAEAQDLIQGGVELARSLDHPDVLALLYGQRMILHVYEDRPDEILSVLGTSLGSGNGPAAWRCVLAYAHARAGNRASAAQILADLAPEGFAAIPRDSAWISCMTLLGDACVLLRDRLRAREIHALLLPHERQNAVAYFGFCYLGPVHGVLGRLARSMGRREEARRHLALADLVLERLGACSYQSPIAELGGAPIRRLAPAAVTNR